MKPARHKDPKPVINILQITDMHLYANRDDCLLGLNTDDTFEAIVEDAAASGLSADLILATGDLVHDGSAAGYQRVFEKLGRFGVPVYCLAGNHDEAETLKQSLNTGLLRYTDHTLEHNWQIVFLDSTLPDSEGGHLGEAELATLRTRLEAAPGLHTLVCLHHQPVNIGSRWLDTMAVDNPEDFFAIVDQHPQVRGILWGHVHQEFDQVRNDVRLLSSPSTCIQFLPGSDDFAVEDIAPGYRWLTLHADGRIRTGIKRLSEVPGTLDLASTGY